MVGGVEGGRKGEGEKGTAEARAGETRGGERRQPVKQNIPQSDQTGDSFCLTGAVSLSCGYPPRGCGYPLSPSPLPWWWALGAADFVCLLFWFVVFNDLSLFGELVRGGGCDFACSGELHLRSCGCGLFALLGSGALGFLALLHWSQ